MRGRAALLACTLLCVAATVAAQQVGIAASVPVASPQGSGVRNLAFGAAVPIAGQSVDIDVPAAALPISASVHAGEFRYDIASARGLDFTVSVPSFLTGPGAVLLPVTFAGTRYGGYCVMTGGSTCALTAFDPAAGTIIRVCQQMVAGTSCHPNRVFPTPSELAIYIGGRLSVPPNSRAGAYSATITLMILQVY